MKSNPIQFAVVREDPSIEAALIDRISARRILLIASGGCTALTLQALHPELEITLLDMNPAQLALISEKVEALRRLSGTERKRAFNIGASDPRGLNARGNFESLFRGLARFVHEHVADESAWKDAFAGQAPLDRLCTEAFANKYWPLAFELFFSDSILNAMFGPDATQHAPRGSYPGYFRGVFERGLRSPGAKENYFLHHVLLGRYLDDERCLPAYLTLPPAPEYRFTATHGTLESVADLSRYDLISLSNIFDWTGEAEIARAAARLSREMKPGAALIYRQLNHHKDFQPLFSSETQLSKAQSGEAQRPGGFRFDPALEQELLAKDRSLFYSKLSIGVRR